jgi:hypothetical protein
MAEEKKNKAEIDMAVMGSVGGGEVKVGDANSILPIAVRQAYKERCENSKITCLASRSPD